MANEMSQPSGRGPNRVFSYWLFPLIAAIMWVGTLITMLVVWSCEGYPHYSSMESDQTIAYISDIGADILKPLFIVGACFTGAGFFFALLSERWLRHRGRLVANLRRKEKVLSIIAIIGAAIGTAGIVLLSIFDTKRHPSLHDTFLLVFMVGVIISAVATVVEYWRLENHHRENKGLRCSFWAKVVFLVFEVACAIAFGICLEKNVNNAGAVLEWVVAFVFTGYLLIFIWDLLPATKTRVGELKDDVEMRGQPVHGIAREGQQNF